MRWKAAVAAVALMVAAAAGADDADVREIVAEGADNAVAVGDGEDAAEQPKRCVDSCTADYNGKDSELKSCDTGCTLLSIIEAINLPASRDLDEDDYQPSLQSCAKSCDASYTEGALKDSCSAGCRYQVPLAVQRRKNLPEEQPSSAGGGGFVLGFPRVQIHRLTPMAAVRMPQMLPDFGFPDLSGLGFPSSAPSMPDFNSVFDSMRRRMDSMMKGMMSAGGPEDMMMSSVPEGASGTLTVVKAGPGYREEKTYNFGPEGIEREEEEDKEEAVVGDGGEEDFGVGRRDDVEVFKPIKDDMLAVLNPLEQFFDKNDVETFDPRKEESGNGDKDGDRDDGFSIHGFDIDGPRLPDHGLRSRQMMEQGPRRIFVSREQICARDSQHMKWSDWVSCLHLRMGLPRWLTAATVSLGVVFIIWLCLVIPHSAPKQRVRRQTKAMEAAGKLEEAYLRCAVPAGTGKIDLPPAYDDVANLHVAIPVVVTVGQEEQAGPLPAKKSLKEDDDKEEI